MEEIIELISNKQETKNCDFKDSFSWTDLDRNHQCEIIKDIIAMANTKDGGQIVIGIEDRTWIIKGLSKEQLKSYDVTQINNLLHEYTDPKHSCTIKQVQIEDKELIVIEVPEFTEDIIITKKDSSCIQRGRIYIRTDAASSEMVPSNHEMRELIGRAITKKGDNLLSSIHTLIKGKPIDKEIESYDKDREDANDYLKNHYQDKFDSLGYYELISYPLENKRERFKINELEKIINNSLVHLRGRTFPTLANFYITNNGGCSYFNSDSYGYYTRYYFAQNGLMLSQEVIRTYEKDEQAMQGTHTIDYIDVIYTITEYILFLKRLYEVICPNENISIILKLHKTKDRLLTSFSPYVLVRGDYISKINVIEIKKQFNEVELRASYKDIIVEFCRELFVRFQMHIFSDNEIIRWVNELLKENK
ncbi:MAG: ATP-binding protein [Candidatus Gastranaerophilales bacterium]|nr:ATP-binding protein [Candidatus Gastranaerophilales bacterium]